MRLELSESQVQTLKSRFAPSCAACAMVPRFQMLLSCSNTLIDSDSDSHWRGVPALSLSWGLADWVKFPVSHYHVPLHQNWWLKSDKNWHNCLEHWSILASNQLEVGKPAHWLSWSSDNRTLTPQAIWSKTFFEWYRVLKTVQQISSFHPLLKY